MTEKKSKNLTKDKLKEAFFVIVEKRDEIEDKTKEYVRK